MNQKMVSDLSKNALPIALGAAVLLGVVYLLIRKSVAEVANVAGGIVSGNNAITEGTPYQGAGVAGTLGAAVNSASGGVFQAIGERVSSWFSPPSDAGDMLYYGVTFPDGARHAIGSRSIDKDGFFSYNGTRYRIGVNDAGQRIAVRV